MALEPLEIAIRTYKNIAGLYIGQQELVLFPDDEIIFLKQIQKSIPSILPSIRVLLLLIQLIHVFGEI